MVCLFLLAYHDLPLLAISNYFAERGGLSPEELTRMRLVTFSLKYGLAVRHRRNLLTGQS
jgi:hypothetical protein